MSHCFARFQVCWLICILFFSCSAGSKTIPSKSESITYKKVAIEKYHTAVQFHFNPGRSKVLCMKETPATNLRPNRIDFFVYDLAEDKIAHESMIVNARVSWKNDTQLFIETTPGEVSFDDAGKMSGYLYDLEQGKAMNLGNN